MQIETFKVFCDLVDTASFSRAASLNSITQSAVSQQIRALEERYQVILVERGKRHFSLTQEGRAFLQASKEILQAYGSLNDRIHALQNVVAGELRIATIYSIGLHELPVYLKEFRRRYPEVEVHVEYRRSEQIYTEVSDNNVDLGLVAFPAKRRGLSVESFFKDKLVVICHPEHKLANRKRIQLSELNGEKFIAFEPDLPTRKFIDRTLKQQGTQVKRTLEFDNIETVKRAVEIEHGLSIVPLTSVESECRGGTLVAIEIVGPEMWRPIGVVQKRVRESSPARKQFLSMLRSRPRKSSAIPAVNGGGGAASRGGASLD